MKFIRGMLVPIVAIIFVGWWITTWDSKPDVPLTPAQQREKARQDKIAQEESDADSVCMAAVRQRAKFPGSVDFKIMSSVSSQPTSKGYASRWAFDAKNGFGNMIPYKAECVVVKGKLVYLNITPR